MAHPIRVASLPVGVSPTPGPGEGRLALASIQSAARPTVRGKFLFVGDEKLYIRGVTYGAFAPDAQGNEYQDLAKVERDFAQMAAAGINAVRIPTRCRHARSWTSRSATASASWSDSPPSSTSGT